jgi:hypothetical protein
MAPASRLIAIVLAICLLVLAPLAGDSAKKHKPRFKISERTYHSASFISLPGNVLASRYPDSVEVHGRADSKLIDVDLLLYDFSHGTPKDLDMMLVAPNGRAALVMADAGGEAGVLGIDLILDDEAKQALPRDGHISSGRYRPANYDDSVGAAAVAAEGEQGAPGEDGLPSESGEPGVPGGTGEPGTPGVPGVPGDPGEQGENGDNAGNSGVDSDAFLAPAPAPGAAVKLATFRGIDPSGEWQLFIRADGPGAGSLTGGWGLRITTKRPR